MIDVHGVPPPFLGSRTRRLARAALGLSLVCFVSVTDGRAQQPTAPDPFAPVAFMIGRWEGSSEGQPGKASVRREYSRALNGRFVRVRNRSEYPVQDKNPKGEIHEDEGFFSFDRARKRLVLRQFHVEGFVNQYVQDSESSSQKLVFTTESIENIPAGWRARETYVVHGPDEFEEILRARGGWKPVRVVLTRTIETCPVAEGLSVLYDSDSAVLKHERNKPSHRRGTPSSASFAAMASP